MRDLVSEPDPGVRGLVSESDLVCEGSGSKITGDQDLQSVLLDRSQ